MVRSPSVEIQPASDRSLLVRFGDTITLAAHREVLRLLSAIRERPPGVLNLHPAFASVLIDFDPRRRSHQEVAAFVRDRMAAASPTDEETRVVEIPVCYGGEFGPDLAGVAEHANLTPDQVAELHASASYLVYFLGFSPGFPYLGGLPEKLATPRLPAPRKRVPAGSVAIGGSQTGIYPIDSPGGWRIIGRTSLRLFDAEARPPALLRAGDSIRFVPRVSL